MVEIDERAPFHRRRPCACCCIVLFFLLLTIAIIIVILAFTVFKVKKAEVNVQKVELLNFDVGLRGSGGIIPSPSINITLAIDISVHNPNKASFKYTNSSAILYYHDDQVVEVPIPAGAIGSQATETISTTLVVLADKLITNSHLVSDYLAGMLPVVTKTALSGRVKVLFIKKHVDITSQCSISISVNTASITNNECQNKVHL